MARIFLRTVGAIRIFYTVDEPVGRNCRNKQDDVLLVQFFLKVISETPGRETFKPSGKGDLVTDGIWGPTSQAYLDQFLTETNRRNPGVAPVKVDGRVDPVKGRTVTFNEGHSDFSIHAMQATVNSIIGAAGINDITLHPKFPAALTNSIKKF